jgi:putative acetyltransferase
VTDAPAAIRAEEPGDAQAISDVVAAAFGRPEVVRLVEAIRASPEFVPELSLVALHGDRVVGHVMISHAEVHDDGGGRHRLCTLSPLAVRPDAQHRGIGSALVLEATRRADALGESAVVLEGHPGFYGRLGFEHALPHGIVITLPGWAPPEAAQVCILHAYQPSIRGQVVYPPAFAEVIEH